MTTGLGGMVATTDRYASRVGVDVLEQGGNAVDAAVAVAFALAVVNPEAGNVGGGGYLLVRTSDGEVAALDCRSCAPRAASADMFAADVGGPEAASQVGHRAAAVPGSVLGLWDVHARFGTVPWPRLVEPAIELARGFVVEARQTRAYEPHIVEGLRRFQASAAVFLPAGAVPRVGDRFRQPDLARTLERIRDRGPDGFYRGETADLLVEEMRRGGGLLTHEDLASYRCVWRPPVRFRHRGHTVLSMPPSSSGGVTLALMSHLLSGWDLARLDWHGAPHVHLLAETWRRAYADRNQHLADAAFVDVPVEALIDPSYGARRAESISLDRATPSERVAPGLLGATPPREQGHTTHVSIVDARGGAVSLTTTINTWFGSKVVAEGTGVLLNNDMDDFTARPGVPNFFGLVQGDANAIAPGKRMLSAMTPTLVLDPDGRLSMVVGTPGGATIITTVFQVVSNVLDHGMSLADAVLAPRVHHQHVPDRIKVEPEGLTPDVIEALRERGHRVDLAEEPWGDVQAVRVLGDGTLQGFADPRRGGVALGL